MEETATHAVDRLAPEFLFVICIIAIIAITLIKVVPFLLKVKQSRLENEKEFRQKELELEEKREERKREEGKQRYEREKETTAVMARSVDAQERSTIAINESTAQMAILAAKLELSQQGSISMRSTVDDMATEVHDIHLAVVK